MHAKEKMATTRIMRAMKRTGRVMKRDGQAKENKSQNSVKTKKPPPRKNRELSGSAQRLQTGREVFYSCPALSSSVQLAPTCRKHEGIGKIADKATRL
jgi:hypothetical protein